MRKSEEFAIIDVPVQASAAPPRKTSGGGRVAKREDGSDIGVDEVRAAMGSDEYGCGRRLREVDVVLVGNQF